MKGELKTPDTWEVGLSSGADKCETFTRMMNDRQLGAKAYLMNIRNMLESGVDQELMATYAATLDFSMIFPFEFMKAIFIGSFEATTKLKNKLLGVLEYRAVQAYGNLPLGEKTAVLCDTSGSMTQVDYTSKSKFTPADIAAFYSALSVKANEDAVLIEFSTHANVVKVLPGDSLMRIYDSIRRQMQMGGTNIQAAINLIPDDCDTAIVWTDGQFADEVRNTRHLKKVIIANLN